MTDWTVDFGEQMIAALLESNLKHTGQAPPFTRFLRSYIATEKGRYNFAAHKALEEIAERLPVMGEAWILKGAQVGLSTMAVGWCLRLAALQGRQVGYALPTKVFAARFLKTRFRQLVQANPLLRDNVRLAENVGLIITANLLNETAPPGNIYLLGMANLTDTISIPLDALIYDEVDILNQDNMAWAEDRLAASDLGQKLYFSVGMNPGTGIDAGYHDSTQRVWLVRCSRCGRDDQVLEELFPECVSRDGEGWRLVCHACGAAMNVQEQGRWVARHPDRQVEGYRVPQLIIPNISLDYIMDRWQKASRSRSLMAKFRSSTLALPDAGERQRITVQLLSQVLEPYATSDTAPWTVGGADVGDTCHVAFADLAGERQRFVRLETVASDRMVEEISNMITALGCRCFVIDAKPFRTEARRLARQHPDVVVLQYFKDQGFGTGTETHDGHTYRTVSEQREDSLDAYCDLFDPERPGVLF
ncbi:MAG: phage terminase large subunit family protein, partial [Candidatus Marinimicrobia bacterium]|nr:phage terminase large subunit family protein [Candidatus Neomarinimicrobiota bacterium]